MRNVRTGAGVAGVALLVGLAVWIVFGGSGGSGDSGGIASAGGVSSSSAPAGPEPAADRAERQRQYVDCLREQGIEVSDPEGGKGVELDDGNQQLAKEAAAACRRYAPDAAGKGEQDVGQLREYASCMRRNGVPDFPDPDPTDGLVIPKVVVHSPDFESANRICGAELDKPGSSK